MSEKEQNCTKKKACVACQINRRRCSGNRPCERCTKLGVACVDRADRRKKAFRAKGRSGLTIVDKDMIESIALPESAVDGSSTSMGARIALAAVGVS